MKSLSKLVFISISLIGMAGLSYAVEQTPLESLGAQIAKSPDDPRLYGLRAQLLSAAGKHSEAIGDLDRAIKLDPENRQWIDSRGSEWLLAGQFDEAIADFDSYLAKHPEQAPYHWKRGIALYYAGRYDDGVKQFDIHQTVNSADAENAVWRYLCMARRDSVGAATKDILKIGPDSRIPMSQVYDLFAGKASVNEILTAAKAGNPGDAELRVRLFYAHLYIGLYLDAIGKPAAALEHMKLAVQDYLVDYYMGGIAVVHLALLEKAQPKETP